MKQILLCVLLLGAGAGVQAQQAPDTGPSLMERGARMFLEGLRQEVDPALEGMAELGAEIAPSLRELARNMAPTLRSLIQEVDDWSRYEAPEILPNGDIILRRKPDVPQSPTPRIPEPTPEGPVPLLLLDDQPQFDL